MLPIEAQIQAILFDMNGTLRQRVPDEPIQSAARQLILETAGQKEDTPEFWEKLEARKQEYNRRCATRQELEGETELWTRWMLPEAPAGMACERAPELTLAWTERKGKAVPQTGAETILLELKQRGYRLGLISNSMSSLDIPRFLDTFGWKDCFEVVVISAQFRFRKPSPLPFLEAARRLNVEPGGCAYVGNKLSKDLEGCRGAGYAMGILLGAPGSSLQPRNDDPGYPLVIESLEELLKIFPVKD